MALPISTEENKTTSKMKNKTYFTKEISCLSSIAWKTKAAVNTDKEEQNFSINI